MEWKGERAEAEAPQCSAAQAGRVSKGGGRAGVMAEVEEPALLRGRDGQVFGSTRRSRLLFV